MNTPVLCLKINVKRALVGGVKMRLENPPITENGKIRAAVRDTDGACLFWEGEPILACFHSSSAAVTEQNTEPERAIFSSSSFISLTMRSSRKVAFSALSE